MHKTFDKKKFLSQNSIWLVLIAMVIIMGVAQPSFFTVNNLLTLLSGEAVKGMPCGAAYNNDEKRLWPGEPGDCLDHKRYADTLKKIGFEGDVCTMEVFRPDYYKLSNEENIKKAAEVTKAHVAKYWAD